MEQPHQDDGIVTRAAMWELIMGIGIFFGCLILAGVLFRTV
jgi:hypothetical protein